MTMQSEARLPPGFEDLEPFALKWGALQTMQQRYALRQETEFADLTAFYESMTPRLEAVFSHLDKFPDTDLPAPELRLYRTALGLIEAGEAVEYFGRSRMPGAPAGHSVDVEISTHAGNPI